MFKVVFLLSEKLYFSRLPSARNSNGELATFALPPFLVWSYLRTGICAYKHIQEFELTDIIKTQVETSSKLVNQLILQLCNQGCAK